MLIVDTVITEKNAKKFSINSKTINKDSLILIYLINVTMFTSSQTDVLYQNKDLIEI